MEPMITLDAMRQLNDNSFARIANPGNPDTIMCTSYMSAIGGLTSVYLDGIIKGYTSLDDAFEFGEHLSLVNYLDNKFNYPGIENIPSLYIQNLAEYVSSQELARLEHNDISFTR